MPAHATASPRLLWQYLATHPFERQIDKEVMLANGADYAYDRLKQPQIERAEDLWVERSPLALTIRFRRPSDDIVRKYTLSNERLLVNGKEREYSHIYIMEQVTTHLIDALVRDLRRPEAFPDQPQQGAHMARVRVVPRSDEVSVPYEGGGFK